ncbi:MAG: polysaccharide biosynthesis/export family protein [Pseudomonadota bacterium]
MIAAKHAVAAVLAAALAGCGPVVKNASPIPAQARPADMAYVIEPGDELDVRFFYNPELNEEVMVRPDGAISLPLVGQIPAAGRTVTDLENALRQSYSRELRQAAITVIVKGFAGQRVYVDGQVGEPQMVNILGNMTALQAIASAGGVTPDSKLEEVLVIRRTGAAKPQVIPLNLAKALDGTDTTQDMLLQPYDIVFVPQTGIAEVNQWVDQYIRQNIPVPFGLGYGLD